MKKMTKHFRFAGFDNLTNSMKIINSSMESMHQGTFSRSSPASVTIFSDGSGLIKFGVRTGSFAKIEDLFPRLQTIIESLK